MRGGETVKPRRQPFRGEAGRGADDQHIWPRADAERFNRLADMGEAGLQSGIELLAGRGERDGANLALEQFDAEQFLEPPDLVAERAGRNVELARGTGQAQM